MVKQLKKYRVRNASDNIPSIHLHRHSFELTRVAHAGAWLDRTSMPHCAAKRYHDREPTAPADTTSLQQFAAAHCSSAICRMGRAKDRRVSIPSLRIL